MGVRVVLTVEIKPGEEEVFEREFREVARSVAGAPGLLGQVLCRDTRNPSRYMIMSDWTDRDAFHRFEVSPEQDDATAPVRKHRSSVNMSVCDIVLTEPRTH